MGRFISPKRLKKLPNFSKYLKGVANTPKIITTIAVQKNLTIMEILDQGSSPSSTRSPERDMSPVVI